MNGKVSVLVLHEEHGIAEIVRAHLEPLGHVVTVAPPGLDGLVCLQQQAFSAILVDLGAHDTRGIELVRTARRIQPATAVIVMTQFDAVSRAIAAFRTGADEYVAKPFTGAELADGVGRAIVAHRRGERSDMLAATEGDPEFDDRLLGRSPSMQALKAQIRIVAQSAATVLLVGESGSGKELAARAVHLNSARRNGPFVAVNCAAIPENLLESELFGHEKGAFTGATHARHGLFREAHTGTIFLDEISDMPLALQAKLLRVIQERLVRPVGSHHEESISVRVVSATNRDLGALVAQKRFRADLYYRLAVIPIDVPTLRERRDDIPLLAQHFGEKVAQSLGKPFLGLSSDALAWMQRQRWPGNVRELQNLMERAVTLAEGPIIALGDLRPSVAQSPENEGTRPTLAELEYRYTRRILEETRGDKRAAARILGVSLRTVQRKVPGRLPELRDADDAIAS